MPQKFVDTTLAKEQERVLLLAADLEPHLRLNRRQADRRTSGVLSASPALADEHAAGTHGPGFLVPGPLFLYPHAPRWLAAASRYGGAERKVVWGAS